MNVQPTIYGRPMSNPSVPATVSSVQDRMNNYRLSIDEGGMRSPRQIEMTIPTVPREPLTAELNHAGSNDNGCLRSSASAVLAYCTEPAPAPLQAMRLGGAAGTCVAQTVTNSLLSGIVDGLATFGSCTVGFFIGDGLARLTRRICG